MRNFLLRAWNLGQLCWFGALAAIVFGVRFSMELSSGTTDIGEMIGMIFGGVLFASIPFWVGGWRALRPPKELPDAKEKSP